MVVNSINFLLFFAVVFIVYYLPVSRNNPKFQNLWVFLTSYFFYGLADWKMIPLLLGSTAVFYLLGWWLKKEMNNNHASTASRITTLGVVIGVGILAYFKYLDFFAEQIASLLNGIGLHITWTTLNIVLPVGVSFFTFKLISYIIEIHREHIEPCRDFISFNAYIAFFPTILSGPIDRPYKFLPQLEKVRAFDYSTAVKACYLILWGLIMKMGIADNLATGVDRLVINVGQYSALDLILGFVLYPIQLYADFAGYSNMAIGVGALLGFNVTPNFNYPFFARNVADFWRRWHISLTTWITDYVFTPLNIAFMNLQKWGVIFAVVINLVVIGFWHGANWTYGFFGLYHGLLFIPLVFSGAFSKKKKLKAGKFGLIPIKDLSMMLFTYILVAIGHTIFRAPDVSTAFNYLGSMFNFSSLTSISDGWGMIIYAVVPLILLIMKEFVEIYHPKFRVMELRYKAVKYIWILFLFTLWFVTQNQDSSKFIYFNF